MVPTSRPAIAVLAATKYRAEALALSIAGQTGKTVVSLIQPESSVLDRVSIVVLDMDLDLAPLSNLISDITRAYPQLALVVLGSSESQDSIVRLADAGACGYVPARASFREMLSIIQSARRDEFSCTPEIAHGLFSRLARLAKRRNLVLLQSSGLTIRERQIMELLDLDLSNKEIADRLCIAECTVKNHVHHVLTKLGVRSRTLAGQLSRNPLLGRGVQLGQTDQSLLVGIEETRDAP